MDRNAAQNESAMDGIDVTPTSPLPDVPDAGDESQPLSPPEPVDISTAALNTHAALASSTLNDGDDRTLYEQTLDVYEQSSTADPQAVPTSFMPTEQPRQRRVYIYDSGAS